MYMHGGFGFDYIVFYEWCPKTVGGNNLFLKRLFI